MGCICSKETNVHDYVAENEKEKNKDVKVIASMHGLEAIKVAGFPNSEGSLHSISKKTLAEENGKIRNIERPKNGFQKRSSSGLGRVNGTRQEMCRVIGVPQSARAEQVAAGWPSWLASAAGEAIHGWTPRSPDSYEKINKIGQGTYSSVYRARDLSTDKIVAMKKVRFVNMDPESVRFMAREICILRRLDHPNVMKLEALVTSRISGSLYLVFEYMEHDLAGLLASPKIEFTEPQIKCYARQMFLGLKHCHSRGVLHRDIKGSNLLIDNKGILKIGDFGLATFFEPNQKQPLTSHVVTLWYRAPELLLGATQYGVEIDMWSAGCIIAELFAGKPIMPGRTEVEQMHKIFKLCGSPTEEYWAQSKLPHVSSFKSQRPYKRRVADVFKYFPSSALALVEVLLSINPELRGTASFALKSEFFTSNPLPCDPSSLPMYPPSKEFDVKLREEEAKRQKTENMKGGDAEHAKSNKSTIEKNNETNSRFELDRGNPKNGHSNSNAAARYPYPEKLKAAQTTLSSFRPSVQLIKQDSQLHGFAIDSSNYHANGTHGTSDQCYVPGRNRIFRSGPLMPPGGNVEDMLKEHERQIQEAVRKSRIGKSKASKESTK